jgi:hypothetical protein
MYVNSEVGPAQITGLEDEVKGREEADSSSGREVDDTFLRDDPKSISKDDFADPKAVSLFRRAANNCTQLSHAWIKSESEEYQNGEERDYLTLELFFVWMTQSSPPTIDIPTLGSSHIRNEQDPGRVLECVRTTVQLRVESVRVYVCA